MEKLLTMAQVARQLGISRRGVMEKIARQQLPYLRIGKLVRIPSVALDQFINALAGCSTEEALKNTWAPKGERKDAA